MVSATTVLLASILLVCSLVITASMVVSIMLMAVERIKQMYYNRSDY